MRSCSEPGPKSRSSRTPPIQSGTSGPITLRPLSRPADRRWDAGTRVEPSVSNAESGRTMSSKLREQSPDRHLVIALLPSRTPGNPEDKGANARQRHLVRFRPELTQVGPERVSMESVMNTNRSDRPTTAASRPCYRRVRRQSIRRPCWPPRPAPRATVQRD
ncbi:hypothetical protein AArcMg_1202 [Natrarchaeobaculum sulfurireducens]|uniref:Uncharacterized protein n=1 Tax=Natrarchaeobaculum sulfurireducens TaxID=2044521 RepID=A0A346PGT6_9EURY|nr:hypothetical protein AArc1_2416 [Natrarchaeobaculum sulfurireducens]AXR81218.1 hypothetical protein AArcMg_1202 [Natrarchaeobaculum sulfurireducens]